MMSASVDEIKFSRRKTLAIAVLPGGKVLVRAPLRTSRARIVAFVSEHSAWIENARAVMSKLSPPIQPYRFAEGERIWYLGERHALHLADKVAGGLAFEGGKGFVLARGRLADAPELLTRFYRNETRRLVSAMVARYARAEGFKPSAIRITSARTRWGSCSNKNALNFSFRLAMTPPECVRYVVAHELAHTRAHNHSSAFWALVEQIDPDYKKARAWLKKNGASLPLI